jgi:clan AA aspartic protease
MGEIRIKVRLRNATDDELVRRGQLDPSLVRAVETDAVVDTGAVRSVIPQRLVDALGLTIRGQRTAQYADGRTEMVGLTSPLGVEILDRDTIEEAMVLGDDVLIGQTVLEKTDLLADCANQRVIPNPAHPEGPVTTIRLVRAD